jgi:SAM-dependent methyltransferase
VNETWITHRHRYDKMLAPFSYALLAAAEFAPGETVLDVGCGTGTTTIFAAESVRPDGSVVGIDIDDRLAEEARRRVGNLPNATVVTADAATYRLDTPADVAISRFGTMQFVDQVAAHRNIAKNLRRSGRLIAVVWQSIEHNLWHSIPLQAVQAHLDTGPATPPGEPGPFALADPSRLVDVLACAGFDTPKVLPVESHVWVARDIDDAIGFFDDDAGSSLRASASIDTVRKIMSTLRELLGPYATPGGVLLPAAAWIASASVSLASS